jgi:hypothetical protein
MHFFCVKISPPSPSVNVTPPDCHIQIG